MADKEDKEDARFAWIEGRVAGSMRHLKADKFRKSFRSEDNVKYITEFLESSEVRGLMFVGDNVTAMHTQGGSTPKKLPAKGKMVYFIKSSGAALKLEKMDAEVSYGELGVEPLNQLESMIQNVYMPMLSNSGNQEGWGDVAGKEIVDKLHQFLANVSITYGQSRGETCLPLPVGDLSGDDSSKSRNDTSNKERVHLLESAVITWTRQIKQVLKQDPEHLLKQGQHPTPDQEIKFWEERAQNLNSIYTQLSGPKIRSILRMLDAAKSTYNTPFAKLCKEVFAARTEANSNVKYLQPLGPWFAKIESVGADDFPGLMDLFRPIMHLILLIWKNADYYNTPPRLVVLMREICNSLINQAMSYVSGKMIFDLIEAEETGKAVEKLKMTLKVCGTFKSTYFDYKASANNECANNPWRIQNNALFMRLDSFLERCHDILDLTQTIVQFEKLARIEVGGTKGKTLTTSVQQIYQTFKEAVEAFQAVTYDIMDVSAKQFDDDFYEFRCKIKELERRLGSVLTQGFDDASTITGRFKLLDSFEGLLERPIIQDELEKKHVSLVQSFHEELKIVQEIFLSSRDTIAEQQDENVRDIGVNMPPTSGAIEWCNGLLERIKEPMRKLKLLNRAVMEREEARELSKLYSTIEESLSTYKEAQATEWAESCDTIVGAKLKLTLLRHKSEGSPLLEVNFDPDLVALLRETKYFILMGLTGNVPAEILELFKKEGTYRTWQTRLQLCVDMYNNIMTMMLPVEAPLLKGHIDKINSVIQMGLESLTWKSHGVDQFIEKAKMAIDEADALLSALKDNLARIEAHMEAWYHPLVERQEAKPMTAKDFITMHDQAIAARYAKVSEGGKEIHKTLKEANKICKCSQGHPPWKAYTDFVNCVLIGGLSKVVHVSVDALGNMIDMSLIEANDEPAVLETEINLLNSQVVYVPAIKSTTEKFGIRRIVGKFVEDIYKIGRLVKRLDTGEGTYVRELQESIEVQMSLARIYDLLEANEAETDTFKSQYDTYSFLWTTNLDEMFEEFMTNATVTTSSGLVTLDLEKFDERLTSLEKDKAELGALKAQQQIGWLQVKSNPIKENISMCSAKWSNKFLSHLEDEVLFKLNELRTFIHETREGLGREPKPGDTNTLMAVMGNIRDVRQRLDTTVEMLNPIRETIALLKNHKRDIDDGMLGEQETELGTQTVSGFMDNVELVWDSLVNFTFRVKEDIMPLQNAEVDSINDQLNAFEEEVEAFRTQFKSDGGAPFSFKIGPETSVKDAYALIDKYRVIYLEKVKRAEELNGLQELFELIPIKKYRNLITCGMELKVLKGNWDFRAMQIATYSSWNSISWKEINTDELESTNKRLQKEMKLMGSANSICRAWDVYKDIEASIKDMGVVLPLISELHSPSMRARHWKAIAASCKVGSIAWDSDSFCFKDLLDLKLQDHADDVSEQVETAEKELKIEKKLEVIESRWETLKLDFVDVKGDPAPPQYEAEEGKVYLPRPSDEVVESLEADQMELQGMIGMGKFVRYFKDRVMKWSNTLSDVEENMKDWMNVAKQWASLENIFLASQDIRSQLPDDTKRFEGIDAEFKTFSVSSFQEAPLVVGLCTQGEMSELLKKLLTELAKCQKALNEYLDTKKKIYPRFYFVSNVALLDILSNGNVPKKIIPYLSDCYDSLADLTFSDEGDENPHTATEMHAGDGEKVVFPKEFKIDGAVESWLNELTLVQVDTLKTVQRAAIDTAVNWEVEKPRHQWLFDYPAQTVLTTTQIFWTEESENALEELEGGNEEAVKTYYDKCILQLGNLIKLVEGKLPKADRTKIIALITMDVHSRDVVEALITEKAEGPTAFVWQKQLRNYWKTVNPQMDTDIRICDYKTKYSYEYIGNCGRLVITPLTDRCYITLTTAMRLYLGGAPAGPAGTGKTETTKDLARALALPCYVFNCSDQMNFQSLEDIFKGLSQSGSWGCFDEFNRIPIEVLSVVATQVKTIQDAIVKYSVPSNRPADLCAKVPDETALTPGTPPMKVGYFDFFGDNLCLIPTTSFYITMNPGYAGRTELPENLKALFRSCAMIRPDLALICENMLMAEGFVNARVLSIKFVTLYQLSSELLSPQAHYDWGLRAVKSVLRVAGMLKRTNKNLDEEPVLMRALRDFNTPKIPSNDLPIFLRLISDLFPKYASTTPPVIDEHLKTVCQAVCKEMKPVPLQDNENFVAKVVNFQELLDVRHSVMLIGCAGSGKTEIWRTLLACHNYIGKHEEGSQKNVAVAETVNPKSVTSDELYGYMTLSKDWKDGVLSICMRGMSKNYRDQQYYEYQRSKWVVLDGDIDAVWIESMNTVMDDNKVLTLVSNERIPLSDAMRMVFEINSLKNATPATVSRAGILFINEEDIGWQPYVDSWIGTIENESARNALPAMFENHVVKTLEAIRSNRLKYVIDNIYKMSNVTTLCKMIQNFMPTFLECGNDVELLEQYFVFACVWAFGGAFADDKTTSFRRNFADVAIGLYAGVFKKTLDEGTTVYDYYVDHTKQGDARWTRWDKIVEEYVPAIIGTGGGMTPFPSLFVSTADSSRLSTILSMMVQEQRPVMFVGAAGTGKSVMVKEWLKKTTSTDENMLSSLVTMNYYTDSKALQGQIEGAIDKRSGRRFGPKGNKKLTYFVDDINLPYIEEYGTQNSISLLKQILGYGTFFDRTDLGFKKEIVDVRFVAAMNPKAGSFTITERAQIYFTTLACMMPEERDLTTVFSSILMGHFQGFESSVEEMTFQLVGATIALHKKVSDRFLPSAVKFVYNWNMRELANVFQGLCLTQRQYFSDPLQVGRLWVHECKRVFGDRLVDETDEKKFQEMLVDVSKSLTSVTDNSSFEEMHEEPLVFTSFATPTAGEPAYLGVDNDEMLKKVLNDKLNEYNEMNPVMELVLFQQAIRHICRITRIIERPSGNAMLIGVGGSGKQSLSKLAAFICGCEVKQLSVTSDFTIAMLVENLQVFFKSAGIKGQQTVWLMTDQQIVNEEFLVYINDVLANGWIPDLFPKDDLPGILDGLKGELRSNSIPDTPVDKINFFIQRIKQFLHVVLCFSPVGDTFRIRARRFPGLINSTVIDWFHAWPEEALVSVADRFLSDVNFATPEIRENVAYHMASVHLSVVKVSTYYFKNERRNNYVTPKSYLEFIDFYTKLLGEKREFATSQIERLQNGLDVLANTGAKVADLQEDLKVTMVQVEEKKKAGEVLMEQIGVQRADAEEKKAKAAVEEAAATKASSEAAVIEKDAAAELAEAQPAMDAAADAVNCLSKASLSELKNLKKPPSGVELVTTAVLMMVEGEFKNFKWDRAKKMMGNVDKFLENLKAYDGGAIEEKVVEKLGPLLANEVFTYENMQKKSSAAANLCNWVINIYKYNRIYVKVKPLMDSLHAAQASKLAAETKLAEVLAVVAEVEQRLEGLRVTFMEAQEEKRQVEELAEKCLAKLGLANRLVGGLASENKRWAIEVEKLRAGEANLVGDVLISSAFVGYIGGFDAQYRKQLWKSGAEYAPSWVDDLISRQIPLSNPEEVDPLDMLTDSAKTAQMESEGLPADRVSQENGAVISSSSRWPLVIDPQEQGVKWLKGRYGIKDEETGIVTPPATTQLTKKGWQNDISKAIEQGYPILVENLGEDIDATMDPVLARAIVKKGRNCFITFAGKEIEYDTGFKLFLLTKLSNPHYKPEIQAQCTLVNFIATESGLEDQLLARVVQAERPDKEEEQQQLVAAFTEYAIRLASLEDDLLYKLANAPDDILADIDLIVGIENTKAESNKIAEAKEKGAITRAEINIIREKYRPVAAEASMLYFMLTKLNIVNHMYQYSLDAFVQFFYKAIERAEKNEDVEKRIADLTSTLRFVIFTWVARGLFEAHKIIFLSQLTFNLMRKGQLACSADWNAKYFDFLVKAPKKTDGEENPIADWLPTSAWNACQALASLDDYGKLPSDLVEAAPRFKDWFNHVTPEAEKLPLDWAQLDRQPFQKMLVTRCLRPDRMNVAVENFVRSSLPNGNAYADCDGTLNSFGILQESYLDSSPAVPIYFILSPGADVVADVDRLALQEGMEKGVSYHNVSMGQGQDKVAELLLEDANQQGHWVILNNVHLMPKWLVKLEKMLDVFNQQGSHAKFRLFLSSDPSNKIPIGVLARCIKLTNEPPAGLKANLKRAFCSFSRDFIGESDSKTKAILFGLCQFHSCMMERKKFGPKGFNMMYPFSLGDLRDSAICLTNYLENASGALPWADLKYIFGEIIYGGHIVNDFDRLLANTYLDHFMRDEILDEMELFPFLDGEKESFKSPAPTSYDRYLTHIDENIKGETPLAFGMHPNAEIDFRTTQSNTMFNILAELQPRDAGGDGDGEETSPQLVAENITNDYIDRFAEQILDIETVIDALEEKGPYQNVFIQECEAVNALLVEMKRSLLELTMGFAGELTMSDAMESLMESLYMGRVPGGWAKLAWPSERTLPLWASDLQLRFNQLSEWCGSPTEIPRVTWISGMVNPQSFLTAIKQMNAQKTGAELDKLMIATEITKRQVEDCDQASRDGAYICGVSLQGARWDQQSGQVDKSRPKEMFCPMPVINCKAAKVEKGEQANIFSCPCYKTNMRGPTYVFQAQLKTKSPAARWVMAGVALIMDIGE